MIQMALHLNPPPVLLLVTELRPSCDKTGSHGRISGFGGGGDGGGGGGGGAWWRDL